MKLHFLLNIMILSMLNKKGIQMCSWLYISIAPVGHLYRMLWDSNRIIWVPNQVQQWWLNWQNNECHCPILSSSELSELIFIPTLWHDHICDVISELFAFPKNAVEAYTRECFKSCNSTFFMPWCNDYYSVMIYAIFLVWTGCWCSSMV